MNKLYFVVGSQDLYGEECLKHVAEDAAKMTAFFNKNLKEKLQSSYYLQLLTQKPVLKT